MLKATMSDATPSDPSPLEKTRAMMRLALSVPKSEIDRRQNELRKERKASRNARAGR
jgi:hypothetical protein